MSSVYPTVVTSSQNVDTLYTYYLIDSSSAGITLTMPQISSDGTFFTFIRQDNSTNSVILTTSSGSETIDGGSTYSMHPKQHIDAMTYGSDWGITSDGYLKPKIPLGRIHFEGATAGNEVSTGTLTQGTFVELQPTSNLTLSGQSHFDKPNNGRLRFIGSGNFEFKVEALLSVRQDTLVSSSQHYSFYLAKNGVKIDGTHFKMTSSGADVYNIISLIATISLNRNDYVSVWTANQSGTNGLFIQNLNLSINGAKVVS